MYKVGNHGGSSPRAPPPPRLPAEMAAGT